MDELRLSLETNDPQGQPRGYYYESQIARLKRGPPLHSS